MGWGLIRAPREGVEGVDTVLGSELSRQRLREGTPGSVKRVVDSQPPTMGRKRVCF